MNRDRHDLVADLLTDEIRSLRGAVGVLVQDVPHIAPKSLLSRLKAAVVDGLDLRIAFLAEAGNAAAIEAEIPPEIFSDTVQRAEKWRNERGLDATIVVIATGDEARLSSLHDFEQIGPTRLKSRLVRHVLNEHADLNEVQGRWWKMLRSDARISFSQLLDYYSALPEETAGFVRQTSRELHRLGLLPDPGVFDNPKEAAIRRRLELNRDLVARLQTLTDKDRGIIAKNIANEQDAERKSTLTKSFRSLQQLRRGEFSGAQLDFDDARALLGIRKPPPNEPPEPSPDPPPATQGMHELAATALLNPDAAADLDEVISDVVRQLNELDEPNLRPIRLTVELPGGTTVQGQARTDIVNLMAHMVGEGLYGAWIRGDGSDVEHMVRRFRGDEEVTERWNRTDIQDYLANFDHDAADRIADLFDSYDCRRNEVLPLVRILGAEPLAAAAAEGTRETILGYIGAYQALMDQLSEVYGTLFKEFGPDVDGLIAKFLTLDVVVFGSAPDDTFAVVTPLHPLFLWHYAEYCRIVADQRDRLSERDRRLVFAAAKNLPSFLTALCLPPVTGTAALTLPQVGTIGALPYFATAPERNAGDDGIDAATNLVRAFLETHPPARLGFRLSLVDPPDAGRYLSLIADLADQDEASGAHVTVFRHPTDKLGTQLRLTPDEEDRVARIFRATTPGRPYTFDVRTLPAGPLSLPNDHGAHLVIVFDQTPGQQARATTIEHPIQPLAMPQRLQYRVQAKTVELMPAPGGLFASYFEVAQHLTKSPPASYFSIHQSAELRERFASLSETAQWLVVADRHVDRDLEAGALRIFTGREGKREIAAFTTATDPFRRSLREVARHYNTAITDAELDELLRELTDLLDAGVLAMRPGVDGKVNHSHVKGLLGMLIAARWCRATCPDEHSRMLVSLDDPAARRWLHLREDAQRADLLGIEHGDGYCGLTIFEVKAMQDTSSKARIIGGVVEGSAIEQLLSTRRLLHEVFLDNREEEMITTPARREVLREHIFRELTKQRYTPEERKRWASIAEKLFAREMEAPTIHVHLVEVQLGVDMASLPDQRIAQARDGDQVVPVTITSLNEQGVDALRAATPSTAADDSDYDAEPPTGPRDGSSPDPDQPERPPPAGAGSSPSAPPTDEAIAGEHRPRAFLGEAPGTYGKPLEVWFDPQRPERPLPNPHMAITGETGSGKTQATKALLHELLPFDLPVLILDFKDDYSQPDYVQAEGFTRYDANFTGMPFNPMSPPVDPQSGRVAPMNHIHQLSGILKRIYGLGDQQAFHLRDAMKETYEIQGIGTRPFVPDEGQAYLSFEAIRDVLEREGHNALLGRLSPIFDLGLFSVSEETTSLEDLLRQAAVIRLSQLPGDEVKNAVAEFLLMALYNHLIRQPQPRALTRLLVLDEAWRLVESPFIEPLMREGRAFGLGVVVATQYPKDLPDTVAGSTATKLYFSQTNSEQIRQIQRTLTGKTTGSEAEHVATTVRGLPPLHCLVSNAQHAPYKRVEVTPYFERVSN